VEFIHHFDRGGFKKMKISMKKYLSHIKWIENYKNMLMLITIRESSITCKVTTPKMDHSSKSILIFEGKLNGYPKWYTLQV